MNHDPSKGRGWLWHDRGAISSSVLDSFCCKPGSVPLGPLPRADTGSRLSSSLTLTIAPHLKNSRALRMEHWRPLQKQKTEISVAEAYPRGRMREGRE